MDENSTNPPQSTNPTPFDESSENTSWVKYMIIGAAVFLILGGGIWYFSFREDVSEIESRTSLEQESDLEALEQIRIAELERELAEQAAQEEESSVFDELTDEQTAEQDAEISNPATLVDYSPEALLAAQQIGQTPLLYFAADWCPTCKALDRELDERISTLPSNVVILKANYDTETDLKQQYEVTIQHTLVQLDENGAKVTKWSGGGVDTIADNLEI